MAFVLCFGRRTKTELQAVIRFWAASTVVVWDVHGWPYLFFALQLLGWLSIITSALSLEPNDMVGLKQAYFSANEWNPPSYYHSLGLNVSGLHTSQIRRCLYKCLLSKNLVLRACTDTCGILFLWGPWLFCSPCP